MPTKKVSLDSTKVKPSLASLKPDKTKGVAAKKRAVKRITAASTPKAATPKVRKAVAKKMLAKESAIRATISAKTVSETPSAKKVARKAVAKATPAKKVVKPQAPTEFAVKLPTNMSIRAREKALAIVHMLTSDFKEPAQQVAYISSFVFIVFGSFLALSFSFILPNNALQNAALLATESSSSSLTDTVNQVTSALPIFSTAQTLPSVLPNNTYEYTFSVTNAKNVKARLYSFAEGGKIISLNTSEVYTETYRTEIKVPDLVPGLYKLELVAESLSDGSRRTHDAGRFVVERTESIALATATTTSDESSNDTDANASDLDAAEEPEEIIPETGEEPLVETAIEVPKIIVEGGDFTVREVIKIESPEDTRAVEMYIRPLKSLQPWFLGAAVEGTQYWYFFFDTLKVPNGEYEVVAKAKTGEGMVSSEGKKIRIANAVGSAAVDEPASPLEAPKESTTLTPSPETENDESVENDEDEAEPLTIAPTIVRSFSELPPDELSDASSTVSDEVVRTEINDVLQDYREELSELLKRYAVAHQSGDTLLIELARTELRKSKENLLSEVLGDNDANYLADDIDTILTERFDSLQKRVETFEQLRRSANSEATNPDTDGDGVSDFDEKNLFRTNPEQADTDSDGVTDGVEIMRGFNPLSVEPEAVIVYEMPQDSIALVQEESLKVETVLPVVQTDVDGTALPIYAEIKGKALPNSFVTLYIFSTPTIVTIKTDSDGSFVYTFEKELEDGAHEVYVAVTDNTGAIMARSNPFRFVKEAQAFTPVDTAGAQLVNTESFSEVTSMNSYNIAVGLGILAFGLILLMLGISLREKESVIVKKPAHDFKTS